MKKHVLVLCILTVIMLPLLASDGIDPVIGRTIRSFHNLTLSDRVPFTAWQNDRSSHGENDLGVNLYYDFFTIHKIDGSSLTLIADLERYHNDLEMKYGGNLSLNSVSYKGGGGYDNFYLGAYGKKAITEEGSSRIEAGGNLDLMFLDKNYIDSFGIGLSGFVSGADEEGFAFLKDAFPGDHLFSWGAMLTFNKVKKLSQFLINGGASYGVPVGEELTTTFDLYSTYILSNRYDGKSFDMDDRFMIHTGLYLGYLVSPLLDINAGLKTVLFYKKFSSLEINIGANYKF